MNTPSQEQIKESIKAQEGLIAELQRVVEVNKKLYSITDAEVRIPLQAITQAHYKIQDLKRLLK